MMFSHIEKDHIKWRRDARVDEKSWEVVEVDHIRIRAEFDSDLGRFPTSGSNP